jgi:cytoskeletal protein CcmA (bactofilin family)
MYPSDQRQLQDNADTSLETPSTIIEDHSAPAPPVSDPVSPTVGTPLAPLLQPTPPPASPPPPPQKKRQFHLPHPSKYILLFIALVLMAATSIVMAVVMSHKNNNAGISTQNLTQSQLEQLANNNLNVGDSSQILTVGASAVFGGQVLIKQNLDVAGAIKVGSSLNLPGITVSGSSSFNQISTSQLIVSGDTVIQGQLTVGKNLNIAGSASFAGAVSVNQLTVQSLTLNSDLILNHHIQPGGASPVASAGSAIGNGGTVSISGSDTGGVVTINTGNSASSGALVNVTFNAKFNATPDVIITPASSAAAGLSYYVSRTTTGFSIDVTSSSPVPSSSVLVFDYIVLD